MDDNTLDENLKRASTVNFILSNLTLKKFLMGLLFGVGGIMLWTMWERRVEAFDAVYKDPTMMYVVATGLALLIIGGGVGWIVNLVRGMNETLYRNLRDQITDLRTEVAQVEARERECNAARILDRDEFNKLLRDLRVQGFLPERRTEGATNAQ